MAASSLEVGKKLVDLCKQGKFGEAVESLYAPNIVSLEAMSMPGNPARQAGIDAVRAKNKAWVDNHEVHGCTVTGPFPNGDRFVVFFGLDVTAKGGPMAGKRMKMDEAALYTVQNGKITQEEFFYDMGG
jgi:ketosteroid isomerase-like protein